MVIDTREPLKATINPVNWSDSVNASQKAAGVVITGSSEAGASIEVSWRQADGSRISKAAMATANGIYGLAAPDSTVAMLFGDTVLGTVRSGRSGEYLYILTAANQQLMDATPTSAWLRFSAVWLEGNNAVQSTNLMGARGLWQATFSSAEVPTDGASTQIEVVSTDVQGNISRIKSDYVLIDTQAPAAPVLRDLDTHLNAQDLLDTVLVKGSAEIGSSVMLQLLGETSTARASSGNWIAQFAPEQLDRIRAASAAGGGTGLLSVQVFDRLGNPSAVLTQAIAIDAVAPDAPSFNRTSGSYVTAADRLAGFTLTGQGEPGSQIELTWERVRRTVQVQPNGTWQASFSPAEVPADTNLSLLQAVAVDAVGNRSTTAELRLVIDSVAPAPAITALGGADVTFSLAIDDRQIGGIAEALTPLSLWVGGVGTATQPLANLTADADGFFNLNLSLEQLTSLSQRISPVLSVRQSDAAGNAGVSVEVPFVVDITPPSITLTNLGGVDGILSSQAGDALLSGIAEPNQPLELRVTGPRGTVNLGVIDANITGAFSYSFSPSDLALLGQGDAFVLEINQRDRAGNSSTLSRSFAIDTVAPAAAVITAAGGADRTLSTASADHSISGSAQQLALVTLLLVDSKGSSRSLGTTLADTTGSFSLALTPAQLASLSQGSGQQLLAQTADAAGNITTSAPFTISVDTVALPAPRITAIGGADATITTMAGDTTISGTSTAYTSVQLEAELAEPETGIVVLGSSTTNSKGLFSFNLSAANLTLLGQGIRRFWASVTDEAGNSSRSSAALATVDTVADHVPSLIAAGGTDSVISSVDLDQVIVGQAAAGRIVTLEALRAPTAATGERTTVLLGTAVPNAAGDFSYSLSARNLQDLGEGSGIELSASQPDAVGNVGRSNQVVFAVDTVAPLAPQINSVGGLDSVITNQDALMVGLAEAGAQVSLWSSNDGVSYRLLTTTTSTAAGTIQHSLSAGELAHIQQGSGRRLQARLSDAAGNESSSYPFLFSLETQAPTAPTFNGLSASGSLAYDATAASAGGLNLSGSAPGASEVELRLGEGSGAITITPRAQVDSSGNWKLWLPAEQLPSSTTGLISQLSITALNRHGDRSAATQAPLMIDTAEPTLIDVWQEGSTIRLQLSEQVVLGEALKATDFSVSSGTRSISVASIRSESAEGGGSDVVLQLSETLTPYEVTKMTYSGSNVRDNLGNQLSSFNNRTLSNLASEQSITPPAYNFTTLALTGANNVNIQGNDEDNVLLGNPGDNILDGGKAADSLTGGLGRDTFRFTELGDSLLLNPITGRDGFDTITGLVIGTDIIDGPNTINPSQLRHSETTEVLSASTLRALLPAEVLPALGGAVVSFGHGSSNQRTFLVLNDIEAGYNPSGDGLIEITGFTGAINSLQII